jgi:hypothetical protein
MEQPRHLSEKLLARRWGISHRTLERWRHDARGPAYLKIGGRIVYPFDDIETYETARRRAPVATSVIANGAAQ